MTFGPKRGHVMFIFERFFRDFGLLLIYLLIYLVVGDKQILMENSFLAVIAVIMPIKRFAEYLTTYYSIDHEKLIIKSGIISKKIQEIPLANITAVDFAQPLVLQLAKVYSINVENASSLGSVEEGSVKIVLGAADAVTVKKLLLAKHETYDVQVETPEELATYRAGVGDIILMGFFQVRIVALLIQALAYIGAGAGLLAGIIGQAKGTAVERFVVNYLDNFGLVLLVWSVLSVFVFCLTIGALISFIKFYGFRITDRGNSLFVEYGLFTKKTHTIMKEKISGLVFEQSVIMRLIKRGSLSVIAAGYGAATEESSEEAVLIYPLISESKLFGFLESVLPGFAEEPVYEKSPSKALPYFFLCVRFILAVVLMAGALLIPAEFVIIKQIAVAVAAFLMFMAIASVILESRNAAVSPATKMIAVRHGGFRRITTLLVRNKIEFAEDVASNMKRRKLGVVNLKVGVLAPNQYSICRVRNIKSEVVGAVKAGLLY